MWFWDWDSTGRVRDARGMEWVKLERGEEKRGEAKGEGAARIKGRKKTEQNRTEESSSIRREL